MMQRLTDLYSDTYYRFKRAIFLSVGAVLLGVLVFAYLSNVQIDGESGEKYYVEYGTYGESGFVKGSETVILTSGAPTEITLGHNGAVKVYGLDDNDTYTITEQNANTNGYTLKINDQADGDGVASGTISADGTVKYENKKDATTPTGVIMNVAPYALMVVIAVAGVAVFMRKRVED